MACFYLCLRNFSKYIYFINTFKKFDDNVLDG